MCPFNKMKKVKYIFSPHYTVRLFACSTTELAERAGRDRFIGAIARTTTEAEAGSLTAPAAAVTVTSLCRQRSIDPGKSP
jgi:hypothetical protein